MVGIQSLLAFKTLLVFCFVYLAESLQLKSALTMEKTTPVGKETSDLCPYHPMPLELNQKDLDALASSFAEVSSFIESQVDAETRPGISANIVYKTKIIWEGNFGQISKTNSTKPTGDTIYRIASISKVFPTIFLYKLWESGLVELSDPIRKYAGSFMVNNPFGFNGELTLHDLASQISGLQSLFAFDILKRDYFAWNGTLEETLEKIRNEVNLVIEPRTTCYYSNMAYPLLAQTLARNFTKDGVFETWAQDNIVDVLNLSNTGFVLTDDIKAKMATGYYPTGQKAPLLDLNWFRSAGNYYSTTRDLARLSMSLMGASVPKVLDQKTLVQMLAPVQKCGFGYLSDYTGAPWEINDHENQPYLIIRKDGDIDGYSSTLAMIPDLEFSVSLLMNGARPAARNMAQTVMDTVLPALVDILRKKTQPVVTAMSDPSKYAGVYQIDGIQTWNVTVTADNVLEMTNPADPGTPYKTVGLSYMSGNTFRLTILSGAFPCIVGEANLDLQNGQIVVFSDFSHDQFNQFDIPGLNFFGFKRQT